MASAAALTGRIVGKPEWVLPRRVHESHYAANELGYRLQKLVSGGKGNLPELFPRELEQHRELLRE